MLEITEQTLAENDGGLAMEDKILQNTMKEPVRSPVPQGILKEPKAKQFDKIYEQNYQATLPIEQSKRRGELKRPFAVQNNGGKRTEKGDRERASRRNGGEKKTGGEIHREEQTGSVLSKNEGTGTIGGRNERSTDT